MHCSLAQGIAAAAPRDCKGAPALPSFGSGIPSGGELVGWGWRADGVSVWWAARNWTSFVSRCWSLYCSSYYHRPGRRPLRLGSLLSDALSETNAIVATGRKTLRQKGPTMFFSVPSSKFRAQSQQLETKYIVCFCKVRVISYTALTEQA